MDRRALGQTGIMISPLGLGTVKFGRNQGVKYPQGFEIPDETFLADFLATAKDHGVNMLDTAPAYGESEERLGRLLAGQRQDWVIVGKVGEEFANGKSSFDFSPDHFRKSLERSLMRIKTDYLDVLLIHSDGRDLEILSDDRLLRVMQEFKDKGLVRAIGASTKSVTGGVLTLEHMDVVMTTYNPAYTDEKPVIDLAEQLGKGCLLKKILASGHVNTLGENPVESTMRFIFSHPGVSGAVIGTITPQHFKENIRAAEKALASLV